MALVSSNKTGGRSSSRISPCGMSSSGVLGNGMAALRNCARTFRSRFANAVGSTDLEIAGKMRAAVVRDLLVIFRSGEEPDEESAELLR